MENSKKGFVGIVLLLIISVAVIGGVAYVYTQNNKAAAIAESDSTTTSSTSASTFTSTKRVEKGSEDFSYKADVTDTVNCGNEDCFSGRFASCEPALLQADIGIGAAEYRILGKTTNGCSLNFRYTKYPDPSWVNKDMTCEFDNKVSFTDSMSKVFTAVTTGGTVCKGPLFDILRPR